MKCIIWVQRACGKYILGEKLRTDKASSRKALQTGGRYKKVSDSLQVKEVVVQRGSRRERFIIAFNPKEAQRDKQQLGTFLVGETRVLQRTELAKDQRSILKQLNIPVPRKVLKVENLPSKV